MGYSEWFNYNFYKIDKINEKYVKLYSKAPLEYLLNNKNYYYCYNFCFRNQSLDGTSTTIDFIFNDSMTSTICGDKILIPNTCKKGDYLVIYNDLYNISLNNNNQSNNIHFPLLV